ncbi:uncharacterized protein G2W53_037006 [Senna tora]|uniref:Uncharacterized protein n=1 Tax=Senna tora TaxID=362788 RepID=A0A834STK4_9FABA|nr:uncharacterized protein G2W53_037006 [Senna tora]
MRHWRPPTDVHLETLDLRLAKLEELVRRVLLQQQTKNNYDENGGNHQNSSWRVILASTLITGLAYVWYKWMCPNQQLPSWDGFLELLLFRFGVELKPKSIAELDAQHSLVPIAEEKAFI